MSECKNKKPKPKKTSKQKQEEQHEALTPCSVSCGIDLIDGVEYLFLGDAEKETETGIRLEDLIEYLAAYARGKKSVLSKYDCEGRRDFGLV